MCWATALAMSSDIHNVSHTYKTAKTANRCCELVTWARDTREATGTLVRRESIAWLPFASLLIGRRGRRGLGLGSLLEQLGEGRELGGRRAQHLALA